MSAHLVWLRNDLRLHDHAPLAEAARAAAADGAELAVVYVADPRLAEPTRWGPPKQGAHWHRFRAEALADLRESLRAVGSDLIVRTGRPEAEVPELVRAVGAGTVWLHDEPMPEEQDVEAALRAALPDGVRVEVRWGFTLLHPADLPFEIADAPDGFSSFRRKVEGKPKKGKPAVPVRDEIALPEALPPPPALDAGEIPGPEAFGLDTPPASPRATGDFPGGETAALARLQTYVWDRDRLRVYKETRNGMLGPDDASRLSPYFAHGCLSPRRVHSEVKRYEAERVANESTYWLIFELLWRDHFRFYGAKHGANLFAPGGPQNRDIDWPWHRPVVEAWRRAETGIPIVDANLRELAETGYMSNRGRQNVASFFAKTLGQDWRGGAAWFETELLDYDVTSNWGNWAYVSGVGADPRDRWFDVVGQSRRYDPDGEYLRHWLPELADVPTAHLHAPGDAPTSVLQRSGITLGAQYPAPIAEVTPPERSRKQARRQNDGRRRRDGRRSR